jgi:hypothetical protein
MSEPEEFNRENVLVPPDFHADPRVREYIHTALSAEADPLPGNSRESLGGRVFGSPLPMGGPAAASAESGLHRGTAPPGRALAPATPPDAEDPSSAQRAMNILKQAVPFVQKLLPLIDGSFGAAISNLLAPRPHPAAPPANVDLAPVQNQISELQMQHNELRSTVQEQTTGIKRVEDQLEMVREATDRNTLEQQELIDDLKAMGNKVNLFAVTLSALLLLSLVLNVILYLHIKRVLP